MIYRIVLDGEDIYDSFYRKKAIFSPQLELEINTAGSLTFGIQSDHEYYNRISFFKSDIEVYENDELIWFGRPLEQRKNFKNQKDIYCEGALSFFNDSIQLPFEYTGKLYGFFQMLIERHNAQVDSNHQFHIGNLTISDKDIYRKVSYEKTLDCIKSKCLDAEGGYLFCRKENGQIYLDWLNELPFTTNQPIEFGLNMLDFQSDFDGSNFATCIIPLGQYDKELGTEVTIAPVNGGSVVYESEAVNLYGRITIVQNFSNIIDPSKLLEEGKTYLENIQFNSLSIECTAADLHAQNENYEIFKLGQIVHCFSNPHLIDRDLPLSKMSLNLDSAAKQITLGVIPRKSFTNYYNEQIIEPTHLQQQLDELSEYIGYEPIGDYPIYDPEYPDIPYYPTDDPYSLDDRFGELEDDYGRLSDDLDGLSDYLGYGDDPTGENILGNLDQRLKELENNSGGGSGNNWYPRIWIGTEAQFVNDESNYIRTLDASPVAGKSYYVYDKSIPGYKEYTLSSFQAGTVYYERYSSSGEYVISFIVDELTGDSKNRSMKVPSAWEVSEQNDNT